MKSRVSGEMAPFSEYEIDLYLVGDAPEDLHARIEAHMASDHGFAEAIREQRAEQEAFYVTRPRLPVPAVSKSRTGWVLSGLGVAVAAATLMVVFVPNHGQELGPSIRTRGGLKTKLTVRRDDRVFVYGEAARLRAGDQIRVSIESPVAGYLSVLGREGKANWSALYDAIPAKAGSFTAPGSRILDTSLVEETWYVVLTPEPVAAQQLIERLTTRGSLPGDVSTLVIRKEPVP